MSLFKLASTGIRLIRGGRKASKSYGTITAGKSKSGVESALNIAKLSKPKSYGTIRASKPNSAIESAFKKSNLKAPKPSPKKFSSMNLGQYLSAGARLSARSLSPMAKKRSQRKFNRGLYGLLGGGAIATETANKITSKRKTSKRKTSK